MILSNIEYLPRGTILNKKYEIVSSLATGGFGQTYIAKNIRGNELKNSVLIKRLRPQKNQNILKISRKKFKQEAEVLKLLGERHPQIPNLFDYFEQEKEFYIAQEYVDGLDLQKRLYLDPNSTQQSITLTELQLVNFLEQTLDILEVVHNKKKIHMDIKPSNLIWCNKKNHNGSEDNFQIFLIDFGCVKEIDTYILSNGKVQSSVIIGTQFYMAPEQIRGQPQFNSDIYALGLVAIQAVTGIKVNDLAPGENIQSIWQEKVNIKKDLKLILSQMVNINYELGYRYQTASEILEDLERFKKNSPISPITKVHLNSPNLSAKSTYLKLDQFIRWKRWLKITLGLVLLSFPLWIIWEILLKPRAWEISDKLSIGEEVYFKTGIECTDEVRDKKFASAERCFAKVKSKNLNNPETAIYHNNSLALKQNNRKPFYLAAAVPISTNENLSKEILRGIAHAQHLFNKQGGANGRLLVVVIVDDANNKDSQAIDVAKLLRDENKIVGIIGHNSTTATKAAIQEYKQKNFPIISPAIPIISATSSGNELNNKKQKDQFFRTVLSDEVVVKGLINYLNEVVNAEKVAVFYDSLKDHPVSAKETLIDNLEHNKIVTVESLNIDDPNFFHLDNINNVKDAKKIINVLLKNNIQHLVLFPDVSNFQSIQSISRAIENTPQAQNFKTYGVTPLYNPQTIQTPIGENLVGLEGMILAIDWARTIPSARTFLDKFKKIWESRNSLISWRTANSYDATQVFLEAFLNQNNSRSRIINYLQNDFFLNAEKTSGKNLSLNSEGNRNGNPIFVELVVGKNGGLEFRFKCEQIKECKKYSVDSK